MVKLYPLLVIFCLTFLQGCSLQKEYEINLDHQSLTWTKEFEASGIPFSGESLIIKLKGSVTGKAQIFAYSSSDRTSFIKKKLIGPGEFTFSITELEYWGKNVLIEYVPNNSATASINGFIVFDGTPDDL